MYFIFSFTLVNAQVTTITTIAGATAMLDAFESTANNILNKAEYSMNSVINNAALNMLHIVGTVETTYKELLKETGKELTKQQSDFFNGLNNSLNNLTETIENEHNRVDQSLREVGVYLSNTILSNKESHISTFNFPQIIRNKSNVDVKLVFRGVLVNDTSNYITINGKQLKPDFRNSTATELIYLIDKQFFLEGDDCPSLSKRQIEFNCFYKQGFFKKKKLKKYYFYIIVLPEVFGTSTIKYKSLSNKVEEKHIELKSVVSCEASGSRTNRGRCNGAKNVYPVDANEGWKIDRTKEIKLFNIKNHGDCSGDGSQSYEMTQDEGITVKVNCVSHTGRHEHCNCSTGISFSQKRNVEVSEDKEIRKKISYLEEIIVPLDKSTLSISAVEVVATYQNCLGSQPQTLRWVFTKRDNKNENVEIEFDEVNKQVIIRPKMKEIY